MSAAEKLLTLRRAEATGDPAAAGYVLLAAYTGIRRGHLLRLTHHDVQGEFIRLDRSSKTRALQMVPLHPKVQALALPLGIGDRRLGLAWTKRGQSAGCRTCAGMTCATPAHHGWLRPAFRCIPSVSFWATARRPSPSGTRIWPRRTSPTQCGSSHDCEKTADFAPPQPTTRAVRQSLAQ